MIVDPKIVDAIREAAQEKKQSLALAERLVAWFDAVASGNEDINDRQSATRRLELLYGETRITGDLDEARDSSESNKR